MAISRQRPIEQQQHGTHWNIVENKVGRMGEFNKNKRKTHEERWHVKTYDGRRSGGAGSNGFGIESVVSDWSDSIDGFDGWIDTGIGSYRQNAIASAQLVQW